MRSSHQTLVFGFHLWECGNHFPRGKCALGGHILRRQGMSLSALRQGFKRYWILLKVTIMLGIVIFFLKRTYQVDIPFLCYKVKWDILHGDDSRGMPVDTQIFYFGIQVGGEEVEYI